MEGLGAAASVIATVQIAAEITKLCGGYLRDVQHAREDIERLLAKTSSLREVLVRLQAIPQSTINKAALQQCCKDLTSIRDKLEPKKAHTVMKRVGLRALKWPFTSKEVDEKTRALEGYLSILSAALQLDVRDTVTEISDKVADAEVDRWLDKLAYVSDAPYNSYENQRHRSCLEDTRVEVLQQIMDWATSTSPQCIFWLKGMAGTGKSTIAITVASLFARKPSGSFFFKRGFGDLAQARKLIPTIVRQLSRSSSSYRRLIMEILRTEPDLGQSANLREQYEKLILEPFQKLQALTPTDDFFFIIIDALDECDDEKDVRLLLRLLATTKDMPSLRLRVFVTSRPEWPIRLGFQDMPTILHRDLVLHDIPRSVVDCDIETFLRHELGQVQQNFRLPGNWPENSNLVSLTTKAAGLFIYAATVSRYVGGSPQADPQERLEEICNSVAQNELMTEELDQMYTIILQNSVKGRYTETERQRISFRFRRIVGSIVLLFSPLSVPSLFQLLHDVQLQDQRHLEITLEPLHALLDVPIDSNYCVQPLHLSFRDFLLDQSRCLDRQFWVDEQRTHQHLTSDCLRLLSSCLKRNLCRLPSPGILRSEVAQEDIDKALTPAVQYACRYWVEHARAGGVELLDQGYVHNFLRQHFLHWVEAMSLLEKTSEAIIAITNLSSMTSSQQTSPKVYILIHDCYRFLLAFQHVIALAPEQIYASALFFTPNRSSLRKCFEHEIARELRVYPPIPKRWNASLLTLEGHSMGVTCVAFSPNNQVIASSSKDGTVRLWDGKTGECRSTFGGHAQPIQAVEFSYDGQMLAFIDDSTIQLCDIRGEFRYILEGHSESVSAVVFSPKEQILVSGSHDGRVMLWDMQGQCRSILKGHSGIISAVAFSPNGQQIASGSDDKTVRLWDIQGDCCSILRGHSDTVRAIAFSPNGQQIASGSNDMTVRLWDTQMYRCHSVLEAHLGEVTKVVFSPDSQLILSVALEGMVGTQGVVRLWDVQTGNCRFVVKVCFAFGNDVAFSPDSQLVILGSRDGTLRGHDVHAGDCRFALEGHSDWVEAVAFSPDGQVIASGSDDGTVRLWDAQINKAYTHTNIQHNPIHEVAFSPDGQLVALISFHNNIQLWDVQTGEFHSHVEGPICEVITVAFSPDSELLASGSMDKTVRLWNIQRGVCQSVLEGHTGTVQAVKFSPDGKLLASGSWDEKVRLWNVQGGVCQSVLQSHTGMVEAVIFSPDGELVASGSWNNSVQLWNVKTGESHHIRQTDSDTVVDVAFSPNGKQFAARGDEGRIRFWDVQTGTNITPNTPIRSSSRLAECLTGSDTASPLGLHISATGEWVMKSQERILWLPPEYRNKVHTIHGSKIAFGTPQGHVRFLSLGSLASLTRGNELLIT